MKIARPTTATTRRTGIGGERCDNSTDFNDGSGYGYGTGDEVSGDECSGIGYGTGEGTALVPRGIGGCDE